MPKRKSSAYYSQLTKRRFSSADSTLNKNILGVKKGEAKSEAPKLDSYSRLKGVISDGGQGLHNWIMAIFIMMYRQPYNNPMHSLSYIHTYIMCIRDNSYKHNYNLSLGHIFSYHITALKNVAK